MRRIITTSISLSKIFIFSLTFILILLSFSFKNNRLLLYTFEVFYVLVIMLNIGRTEKVPTIYLLWSFVFFSISLISAVYAIDQYVSLKQAFNVLRILLVTNSLVFFVGNNKAKLDFVLHSVIVSAIFLGVTLAIKTDISIWGTTRLGSSINMNSNDLGLNMAISSIIAMYFGKEKRNYLYYAFALMASFITFMSGSRKAFFLVIIGYLLIHVLTTKKRYKLILVIPMVVTVILMIWSLAMEIPFFYNVIGNRILEMINGFLGIGYADFSTLIRIRMIEFGIELFKARPILGYGLANYAILSPFSTYAHNNYIELIVGVGLLGLILYYFAYLYLIRMHLKYFKRIPYSSLFLTLLVGLIIMEFGLVSYYIEIYQIIIASAFSAITISKKILNNYG